MLKFNQKINNILNLEDIQELTTNLEKFNSSIILTFQKQQANCKSLINLLAIGAIGIKEFNFIINGDDENDVCNYLKIFFEKYAI